MKKNKTIQKIHNAYYTMGLRFPEEVITVSKLTKAAGVARNTFYSYYNNLPDLVYRLENELLEPIFTLSKRSYSAPITQKDLSLIISYCQENADKIHLIRYAPHNTFLKKLNRMLNRIFTQYMERNQIPFTDFQKFTVLCTFSSMLIPSTICPEEKDADILASEFLEVMKRIFNK